MIVHIPVGLHPHPSLGVGEPVAGGQLANVAEDGARRRHILMGQIAREARQVESATHGRMLEEGLQLRGEDELVGQVGIVERLDPQAVTRQQQRAGRLIPDRNGKHTLQTIQRG